MTRNGWVYLALLDPNSQKIWLYCNGGFREYRPRATELPAAFDYFSVTAGPQRLADRFATQPSVTGFRDFQCFGGPRR